MSDVRQCSTCRFWGKYELVPVEPQIPSGTHKCSEHSGGKKELWTQPDSWCTLWTAGPTVYAMDQERVAGG